MLDSVEVFMEPCASFEKCGFFEKYGHLDATILPMLASIYCRGPLQGECVRLRYFDDNGCFPNSDIAPTGLNFMYS